MININLLPGAKKSGTGSRFDFSAMGALRDQVKDPWMLGASVTVALSIAVVGLLFTGQQATAADLTERLDRAQRDSTRYSSVLAARYKILAERDSVERQLDAIRLIDDSRYQWAHILDEASRALPAAMPSPSVTVPSPSPMTAPPWVATALPARKAPPPSVPARGPPAAMPRRLVRCRQ